MQRRQIPGLALLDCARWKDRASAGLWFFERRAESAGPPETIFQSGSMGKQFTAEAVMMLVEQGKLSLDDPLTKFFPDAPAAWKQVKVKNLLSHTAGFGDYPKRL